MHCCITTIVVFLALVGAVSLAYTFRKAISGHQPELGIHIGGWLLVILSGALYQCADAKTTTSDTTAEPEEVIAVQEIEIRIYRREQSQH